MKFIKSGVALMSTFALADALCVKSCGEGARWGARGCCWATTHHGRA